MSKLFAGSPISLKSDYSNTKMLWCSQIWDAFFLFSCSGLLPMLPSSCNPSLTLSIWDTCWSSSLQHCALLQFRHGRLPHVLPQRKRGRVPLNTFLAPSLFLYYSAAYGHNLSACVFQHGRKYFEDGHACWHAVVLRMDKELCVWQVFSFAL